MRQRYVYVGEPRFGFEVGKVYKADLLEEQDGCTLRLEDGTVVTAILAWLEGDPQARILDAASMKLESDT